MVDAVGGTQSRLVSSLKFGAGGRRRDGGGGVVGTMSLLEVVIMTYGVH